MIGMVFSLLALMMSLALQAVILMVRLLIWAFMMAIGLIGLSATALSRARSR